MIHLSICCLGFSGNPEFKTSNTFLTQFLKEGDKLVETLEECNTLLIGDFLKVDEMSKIVSPQTGQRAIMLFLGEPRCKFKLSQISDLLWKANAYHGAYGCISGANPLWVKYPLYIDKCLDLTVFNTVNTYVQTSEPTANKRFAALINRHDPSGERAKIYNEILKTGLHVDCPGQFMNNCSNNELNRMGKPEWLKQYLFNICFENHVNVQPGYITEKLMDACLSGTIPIYNGKLDEIDELIFNKDRILFYDTPEYGAKMDWLMASDKNYAEFYRQPVFMPSAADTIQQMTVKVQHMFDGYRDIVAKIQSQTKVQVDNISPVKDESQRN